MASNDKFLTRHPEGKQGTRIARDKYEAMKEAMLAVVPRRAEGVVFRELSGLVKPKLPRSVFGPEVSVGWYVTTVKLDLEARGLIERVPGSSPQRLRRTRKG